MIGEWIRFGLAALCVLAGCFALLTAIVGLFRFDFFPEPAPCRLHSRHPGSFLLVLAVMLAVGLRPVLWKLLLMVILQWCTSPLSGHMLAQFEYRVNQNFGERLPRPPPENGRTEHEHDLPHSPAGGW